MMKPRWPSLKGGLFHLGFLLSFLSINQCWNNTEIMKDNTKKSQIFMLTNCYYPHQTYFFITREEDIIIRGIWTVFFFLSFLLLPFLSNFLPSQLSCFFLFFQICLFFFLFFFLKYFFNVLFTFLWLRKYSY